MLQGFFGFVLGVIVSAVLLAYQPQLIGDVQQGLSDLHSSASNLTSGEVAASVSRPFVGGDGSGSVADGGRNPYGYAPYGDYGGYGPGQTADASYPDNNNYNEDGAGPSRDPNWGSNEYGREGVGSGPEASPATGAGAGYGACLGSIALQNKSNRRVEIRLAPRTGDGIDMVEQGPIDLNPGTSVERSVRATGDCTRWNQAGAMTLKAEICPLDGSNPNGGCYSSELPVSVASNYAGDSQSVLDRRTPVPEGSE